MFDDSTDFEPIPSFRILVAIRNAQDLTALLQTAYRVAQEKTVRSEC